MKTSATALLLILLAATAFAHAGHVHTYMGTVTMLHDDQRFMMKTTDGKDLTIQTAASTTYAHADGSAATRAELAEGVRVVVKMALDGKTASSVKMGK
jgi:hypothetical protein